MGIGVNRGCNDVERRTTFGGDIGGERTLKEQHNRFTLLHWYK